MSLKQKFCVAGTVCKSDSVKWLCRICHRGFGSTQSSAKTVIVGYSKGAPKLKEGLEQIHILNVMSVMKTSEYNVSRYFIDQK